MIYTIPNITSSNYFFVCPDQASVDQGKTLVSNGIFSVGGQAEADAILANQQQAYLPSVLHLFSVNKDTDVTDGTCWEVVDLETEPNNTDVDYQVFDVVTGLYTLSTGLTNAKALLAQKKQEFLDHQIVMESFDTWPTSTTEPTQTGTQNF